VSEAADGADDDDVEEISGLHEVSDLEEEAEEEKHDSLDHLELSSDGAPVPARGPAAPQPLAAAPAPAPQAIAPVPAPAPLVIAPVPRPQPVAPVNGKSAVPSSSLAETRPTLLPPPRLGDLTPLPTAISRPRPQRERPKWPLFAAIGGAVVAIGGVVVVVLMLGRAGELQISTDPPDGVRILIDNRPAHPDVAGRIKLDPGSYALAVEREGYVQWRDKIEVKAGESLKRRVELEPLARAGFTLVSDPPGASATLDGKDLGGRTPFKVEGLLPGKHLLEVSGSGKSWSEEITLEPGKMIDIKASLEKRVAEAPPAPPKEPDQPVVKELPPVEPVAAARIRQPKVRAAKEPAEPREPPVRAAKEPAEPKRKLPAAPVEKEAVEPKVAEAPKEKPAGAGEGYLRIGSKPWTKISVDGKDTGLTTPQTHLKLSAGNHKVTLTNPQFSIKETFTVEIKGGETETVIKDLRPPGGDE
jgi:hypothetical protein